MSDNMTEGSYGDPAQSRASWAVKDEAILDELIELLSLSDKEKALLASMQDEARAGSGPMVKAFYDRLFAHENTKEYFAEASMERLQSMIADWFVQLFSGTYDRDYASHRLTIGQIHVKIGLPVRYPLAMLDIIGEHGAKIAEANADNPEAAKEAFRKVLALDVAIFNQAYEDNQLKHLSELVGGERLARLLLSGAG